MDKPEEKELADKLLAEFLNVKSGRNLKRLEKRKIKRLEKEKKEQEQKEKKEKEEGCAVWISQKKKN